MTKKQAQIEIEFPPGWGGPRKGAGRKRKPGRRKRVPHRVRPKLASRFPVHVNTRLLPGLPRLRGFEIARVLRRAFVNGCNKDRFRICQFSVQGNHLHLICEARDGVALARGVKGWKTRITRALNKLWKRKGTVFDDRYHEEILRTPEQVRNAICYVIQNARRHGQRLPAWAGGIDPFSSAWHFDGWRNQRWRQGLSPPLEDSAAPGDPVAPAHTWLLATGCRRSKNGLIDVTEIPAAGLRKT
jgi:REP element-mobilizing transposase RayT